MNLSSFIGNDDVKNTINRAFISGRLPHALILQGEDGLGKYTLARLIAKAVVCRKDKLGAPCGQCPSCVRAEAGSHPDIRVVEGTGASKSISVESVRKITADAYRMPEEADYNVYIICAGNGMSKESQNKLLKIIEEPPDGTLFIFIIRSADSLLATIRSRATILTLHPVKPHEAVDYISSSLENESDKISEAVELFGGNIGKILEYISGEQTSAAHDIASQIAAGIVTANEHQLLAIMAPMIKDKQLFSDVADNLYLIFRDACVLREGSNIQIGTDRKSAEALSQSQTKARLVKLPEICTRYSGYCRRNANMTLLVTAFCAELRATLLK